MRLVDKLRGLVGRGDNQKKHCEYIMSDGSQCRAFKLKGGQYCFKHSQAPEERKLMAKHGGLSGKVEVVGFGKRIEINKPRHIRKALVNTLNLLKDGKITPAESNAIAYLCSVIIKNFELIEFEERLKEIEKAIESRGYSD